MANGLLDLLGGLGTTPPSYLEGLLGAQQTEDLRKRSIGTGLANALVGYLAMPKNQNLGLGRILAGSAQAGMQGAQGVYAGALGDYETQQKIAEMQRKKDKQSRLDTLLAGVTDPKERLAIEYSPDQYFAATFKPKESNISKPTPDKFTAASLNNFATSGNYGDLDPIDKPEKSPFGSSVEGASYGLLIKGSENTPEAEAIRSSPAYRMAHYTLTAPKTVMQDRQDSVTGVVTQVPVTIKPAPLPAGILPPINLPQPTATNKPVTNMPMPVSVTSTSSVGTSSPAKTNVEPKVGDELTSNNVASGNVKSNPMALSTADAGKVKVIQTTQKNIVNAANRYEQLLDNFDYDYAMKNPLDKKVRANIAALNGAYRNLQMQAKNGYELGALAGPDIGILTGVISDPTSIQAIAYGKTGLKSQLNEFKTSMNEMRRTALDTYGIKIQPVVVQTGKMELDGKVQKVFKYDDGTIRNSKGSVIERWDQ